MATESERRTRRERVDPRVRRAGWASIVPFAAPLDSRVLAKTAVEEFETANGPADYALCSGEQNLGVVEAKTLALGPKGVLGQAGRYSEGIAQEPRYQERYGVPFLYSTNGEKIRFHDCRDELNLSRDVAHFHSPAALCEQLERNQAAALAGIPLHLGLWVDAIENRVELTRNANGDLIGAATDRVLHSPIGAFRSEEHR